MTDKKAEIYRCGKELFIEKGFRDTGVADIMQRAGFATGTFYRYYPSKDHLFMEIYNQENVALKRAILGSIDPGEDPPTLIREMMRRNVQGMLANPILKEWFNREVFHKIEQRFRRRNAIEQVDYFYDKLHRDRSRLQREGGYAATSTRR
jgi:AcrR family transcriptional regulator